MYLHEIENITNIWFNCKKALNQPFGFLASKHLNYLAFPSSVAVRSGDIYLSAHQLF
jgi:hypothetical protein